MACSHGTTPQYTSSHHMMLRQSFITLVVSKVLVCPCASVMLLLSHTCYIGHMHVTLVACMLRWLHACYTGYIHAHYASCCVVGCSCSVPCKHCIAFNPSFHANLCALSFSDWQRTPASKQRMLHWMLHTPLRMTLCRRLPSGCQLDSKPTPPMCFMLQYHCCHPQGTTYAERS